MSLRAAAILFGHAAFAAVVLTAASTEAGELFENWTSVRAMGMGGAYSAVVDDATALFFNPAALEKISGFHVTVLTPQAGADDSNVLQDYQNLAGGSYASAIHGFLGKPLWADGSDMLAISSRGFALAGVGRFDLSLHLNDPSDPNLSLNVRQDVGVVAGVSFSISGDDSLKFGASFKRITRKGADVVVGSSAISAMSNAQLDTLINNTGVGYGADLGLLYEVSKNSHATLSAVWHDVGQTTFTPTGSNTAPPPMENDPVLGFAMIANWGDVKFTPSLDLGHLDKLNKEQIGKLIDWGGEFLFPSGFALRAGCSQGYPAAGIGYDLPTVKFDFATYGTELGVYPGQEEDRRFVLSVILDFDINPSWAYPDHRSNSAHPYMHF